MTQAAPVKPQAAGRVSILVIDDEESIRRSLQRVLGDEGFVCIVAGDAASGLTAIKEHRPSLVLLDIWMPGIDGIEALKTIKENYPDLPVIMISGHATIATAISATRLGATDFIEKPLDLNLTLRAVRSALGRESGMLNGVTAQSNGHDASAEPLIGDQFDPSSINPVAFKSKALAGDSLTQKTLARSAILYGQGLHSGKKSGLILEPLPAGSGIHFMGVPITRPVPAHVDFVESTGFATTLRLGQTQAGTIEHLMSALHAYGISNLLIKCNGEVPVMDGSAREFCSLIENTGVEEQGPGWMELAIDRTIRVGNDREFIQLEPGDGFVIDYTLEYPQPIGEQHMVFALDDVEAYKREIAPARTFGFVKDIGMLQSQGLALGGRLDNFVLIGDDEIVNTELRFSNEMVRHKILDAIGDLYLLGRRIRGKVTARMTGHSDNIALLKKVRELI